MSIDEIQEKMAKVKLVTIKKRQLDTRGKLLKPVKLDFDSIEPVLKGLKQTEITQS